MPRHQNSKTAKPKHQVSVKFLPLCLLINFIYLVVLVMVGPSLLLAFYKTRNEGTNNNETRNSGGTVELPGTVVKQW